MAKAQSVEMQTAVIKDIQKLSDKNTYSQWERQPAGGSSKKLPVVTFSPVSTRSTSSLHQRVTAQKYMAGRHAALEEEKNERLRLLNMKITSVRKTIENNKIREIELIKANFAMKELIQSSEKPDHEDVKKLMRRYEKFRGGISYLNENFTTTLEKESLLLTELEQRIEMELTSLHEEVESLDKKLQAKQNHVYVLNNYKDKEYPVKAIRIGELMTELDQVEMANEDDLYNLERVIDTELDKLNNTGHQTETGIKESALNSVLEKMHPSLREMAKQNQVMESEINYHKNEIVQVQEEITKLEAEVHGLITHPKTNVRLQVFPELFKYDTKCTPDMDIVLDIPVVETVPI